MCQLLTHLLDGMLYLAILTLSLPYLSSLLSTVTSWTTASPLSSVCAVGLWGEKCSNLCPPGCLTGCEKKTGKCIEGCGPGWTGSNCDTMCHSFRYGVKCISSCGHCFNDKPCNIVTGRCSDGCLAGFRGDKCDQVCPNFRYGANCINSCGHCFDDRACNIITGKCSDGCLAGFRGDKCDQGCKPFTYGANCNSTCGHCRQNQTCNGVTGQCLGGCDRGWMGRTCVEACPGGYFGLDCQERCGHCIENSTCHHMTGICSDGCASGWTGPSCNQMCQTGRYGSGCLGTCGQCLKGACDPLTGECNDGCTRGYSGPQCQEECLIGWYGENCSVACGHCQSISGCDPINGVCLNGCAPGWQGVFCQHNCSMGTYGKDCKLICGHCHGGASCDVTTGECPSGCKDGWEGDTCETGKLKAEPSFHSLPAFPVLIICLIGAIIITFSICTYFMIIRPRRTALRRLYNDSSTEHLPNTYEQIVGSPWEIQRGQLSLGNELLGNGQFGQVKKGHVKISGVKVPVAIKSLKDNASDKDKTDFLNELSILKRVGKNENVVCLVGACHIRGVMYVAMEYAKYGDLRTFLRQCRRLTPQQEYNNTPAPFLNTALRPQALMKLSLDTAKGLKHLADKQIIHRDVAARNVLLADKLVAKIADFGLSKNDQTYVKTSSTRVPIKWMAVESLFNNTYTLQSDVWSFGVLLWEVFTLGGTPYSSIDSQQLFKYLKDGFRLRKPKLCDQDMYSMMLQCWNDESDRRPTIEELTARLNRMMENSQVYMNINVQEDDSLYSEIDHERVN